MMGFSAGEVALAHALARFPREEAGAPGGAGCAGGAAAAWAAAAREVAARGGLRAEAVPAREVRLSEVGGLDEAKRALAESILLARDKAVRLPPPASRPEAGTRIWSRGGPATLTRAGGRGARRTRCGSAGCGLRAGCCCTARLALARRCSRAPSRQRRVARTAAGWLRAEQLTDRARSG
jgi:hypothetical protein